MISALSERGSGGCTDTAKTALKTDKKELVIRPPVPGTAADPGAVVSAAVQNGQIRKAGLLLL